MFPPHFMDKEFSEVKDWEKSHFQIFWGEIAPEEHLLQVYENEKVFLDTLEGFAGDGILKGERVIIIASAVHLTQLNARLRYQNFRLDELIDNGGYVTMNAEDCMSRFLIMDHPDEKRFNESLEPLLFPEGETRKLRAFGEMVSLLLAKGQNEAVIEVEQLWQKMQAKHRFCLFCAYPKKDFEKESPAMYEQVCRCHTRLIDGAAHSSTEIYHKTA